MPGISVLVTEIKNRQSDVRLLLVSFIAHGLIAVVLFHSAVMAPPAAKTNTTLLQIAPLLLDEKPFEDNFRPQPPVQKVPEKLKPGVTPAKVVTPNEGKKGGSVTGFQGTGGEELGTKGTGEGAGSGGEGGTGNTGSDVYRVGVETMPEPYGGVASIVSRLSAENADFISSRGRSVYVMAFIDEQGIVRKAQVSKGLGNSLDRAVAAAVQRTRFKPGKDKGKLVKVQMMLNIMIPM